MKQSRSTSFFKSCISTAVGFAVAMMANALVLPLFGFTPSLSENLIITAIYTVISIARQYGLERVFEALGWRVRMSPFASAVIAERRRQIEAEGWSTAHDDAHEVGELALAGAAYAINAANPPRLDEQSRPPDCWPWEKEWWKPQGFRRDLVKAGALNLAEGEKFDRSRKLRRNPYPRANENNRSAVVAERPFA